MTHWTWCTAVLNLSGCIDHHYCLIYLEAGNNVRFKGQSWASNAGTYTSTNGTTFVNIVRIK